MKSPQLCDKEFFLQNNIKQKTKKTQNHVLAKATSTSSSWPCWTLASWCQHTIRPVAESDHLRGEEMPPCSIPWSLFGISAPKPTSQVLPSNKIPRWPRYTLTLAKQCTWACPPATAEDTQAPRTLHVYPEGVQTFADSVFTYARAVRTLGSLRTKCSDFITRRETKGGGHFGHIRE